MMEYKLITDGGLTVIEQLGPTFRMTVAKDKVIDPTKNTAMLEATLYKEEGVFVRNGSYIFEAVDKANQPLIDVNIEDFKNAVDFFFRSILDTELYVKSIPVTSSLFQHEPTSATVNI